MSHFYNFPPTQWVVINQPLTQIQKVREEYREFLSEDTSTPKQIEEAVDLYQSLETLFRIWERAGVDMEHYFKKVKQKNEVRGYYLKEPKKLCNECERKNTSWCYLCNRCDYPYDLDDRFDDNFKEKIINSEQKEPEINSPCGKPCSKCGECNEMD